MGVPGFFKWLLKRYKHNKDIVTYSINSENISVLYLDANCLFHPQCFKVLEKATKIGIKDINKIEKMMMKRIINYIDYLITLINPDTVYIAVDGVAPMAKMNQQRSRRFKSSHDAEIYDEIKRKYNKDIDNIWTNTVITPGTEFMERLHNIIKEYVDSLNKNIIYSSYHSVGEGEHKILQHIKENKKEDDVIVIYGLDADLIFLALASNEENVYLLREDYYLNNKKKKTQVFEEDAEDIVNEVAEELTFVSINEFKSCLNSTIVGMIEDHTNCICEIDKNFVNDFIFLCYLLGNDFLPHIPSIDINIGGLDKLIKVYVELYCENSYELTNRSGDNVKINNKFFSDIIQKLSDSESFYFRKVLPKHRERTNAYKINKSDPYEKAIAELEYLKKMKIEDPIRLGSGNPKLWKFRYYEHYFNATNNQTDLVEDMCSEYIKGLRWVTEYYFNRCPCWEWFYPYSHAPFISDISDYFNENSVNMNDIKFSEEKPLTPLVQLLAVLPADRCNILPKSYQHLMMSTNSPIIDMFPKKIKIDMINKDMYWKCIPIIPIMNIQRIKKAIEGISLNKEERRRNYISEPYSNKYIKNQV